MKNGNSPKNTAENQVQKALTPEELTALSNVASQLQEIISMSSGETPETKAQVEPPKTQDMTNPGNQANKELVNDKSDGPTPNDKADRQIEDQGEPENSQDIAKAMKIIASIGKAIENSKVEKAQSQPAPRSEIVQAIESLAQVVKSSVGQQQQMAEAFSGLLEGLGVTKQMEIVRKAEDENKPKPIATGDYNILAKFLAGEIEKSQSARAENTNQGMSSQYGVDGQYQFNSEKIRKSLADRHVLEGLICAPGDSLGKEQ